MTEIQEKEEPDIMVLPKKSNAVISAIPHSEDTSTYLHSKLTVITEVCSDGESIAVATAFTVVTS